MGGFESRDLSQEMSQGNSVQCIVLSHHSSFHLIFVVSSLTHITGFVENADSCSTRRGRVQGKGGEGKGGSGEGEQRNEQGG